MKNKKGLKIALVTLSVIILIFVGIVTSHRIIPTIPSSLSISQHSENPPKLIAHRGFSGVYPQNTIPAFEGAAEAGFWGMECDIHTTKDGKWVVIHDDEISNLTNGEGLVKDFTLDELRDVQMDSGNGIKKYGTLPIPTLEEYLQICVNDGKIIPVIEIKNCDPKYLPSLKRIVAEFNLSEKAVFISFNADFLKEYRKLDKDATILFLKHNPTTEDINMCIEQNFGINFYFKDLIKCHKAIKCAREAGIPIGAWTVDNTIYADVMAHFGAEFITTNKITP
ncbi:MAG: hypothetical protein IJB93_05020 [Clostridia bacterium]|nr:hypothetical protein [Clostridia bacterium]